MSRSQNFSETRFSSTHFSPLNYKTFIILRAKNPLWQHQTANNGSTNSCWDSRSHERINFSLQTHTIMAAASTQGLYTGSVDNCYQCIRPWDQDLLIIFNYLQQQQNQRSRAIYICLRHAILWNSVSSVQTAISMLRDAFGHVPSHASASFNQSPTSKCGGGGETWIFHYYFMAIVKFCPSISTLQYV